MHMNVPFNTYRKQSNPDVTNRFENVYGLLNIRNIFLKDIYNSGNHIPQRPVRAVALKLSKHPKILGKLIRQIINESTTICVDVFYRLLADNEKC